MDPNFKDPKSVQWNVDIQRAITNSLTLDVAYVGVHGYDETRSVDLNEAPVGVGWDNSAIFSPGCRGTNPASPVVPTQSSLTTCAADGAAELAARPYNTKFPYFAYIGQTTSGFISNYSGLQVTLDGRNYHGLGFLTAYTYGHALDDWTKNSQATSVLADPARPQYQYGNSDLDVRHRLRFSPTYKIPGIKSPGQILEGWQISGIWALQSGFAWAPNDNQTDDWGGNGEYANNSTPNNNGAWQSWNYTGPHSAFNGNGDVPIPCYGQAPGCSAPCQRTARDMAGLFRGCAGSLQYATAARPCSCSAHQFCRRLLYPEGRDSDSSRLWNARNATRGLFVGPKYENVDLALQKMWQIKERYSVQLRIECYNVFNQVSFVPFSDGSSDPSTGGGVITGGGQFGFATSGLIGNGGSSNRQFQFGLRLTF